MQKIILILSVIFWSIAHATIEQPLIESDELAIPEEVQLRAHYVAALSQDSLNISRQTFKTAMESPELSDIEKAGFILKWGDYDFVQNKYGSPHIARLFKRDQDIMYPEAEREYKNSCLGITTGMSVGGVLSFIPASLTFIGLFGCWCPWSVIIPISVGEVGMACIAGGATGYKVVHAINKQEDKTPHNQYLVTQNFIKLHEAEYKRKITEYLTIFSHTPLNVAKAIKKSLLDINGSLPLPYPLKVEIENVLNSRMIHSEIMQIFTIEGTNIDHPYEIYAYTYNSVQKTQTLISALQDQVPQLREQVYQALCDVADHKNLYASQFSNTVFPYKPI